MSDTPIYEGQFNAAMQSIRDMLASVRDTLTQRLEDARDALTERLATVEAVQRQASAEAIQRAKDQGALEEPLKAVERRQNAADTKLWGLILIAVGAAVKWALDLLSR
jgi:hypothetical protein